MVKSNYLRTLPVLATLAVALVAAITALYTSTASAQSARDILKQPPFPPTDTSLFTPMAYSDAPPLVPASSGPIDEATLRAQLTSLLKERFGFRTKAQKKKVKKALAQFNGADTKAIVPDPRLRAALISLKGTAGEPAIAGVLDGTYSTVRFFDTPDFGVARVVPSEGGDKVERIC